MLVDVQLMEGVLTSIFAISCTSGVWCENSAGAVIVLSVHVEHAITPGSVDEAYAKSPLLAAFMAKGRII